MDLHFSLTVDRNSHVTLSEQIHRAIAAAIGNGLLPPDARLPSWRDLAAQLGVARGTVRIAYERLIDAQMIVSATPGGTYVARRPALFAKRDAAQHDSPFLEDLFRDPVSPARVFQMGVPDREHFPGKLLGRLRARAVRDESASPASYPNPRGEPELRREIAAHLAISRGLACSPSQVFITSGFSGGLGLSLRVLGLEGKSAWVENPSFPMTRKGLEIARMTLVPVPVDAQGLNVDYGIDVAPDAALVVVTPGQQAPLGPSLSARRRRRLLDWAAATRAWIIEDDYLGELQLKGRVAPSLASLDTEGRVIYAGTFSKTISPTLRLGFVVVPSELIPRFADAVACLAPAPGPSVQLAVAQFIRDGHYMRHLRRTKRIYAQRRDEMMRHFARSALSPVAAGLAVLLRLPDHASDIAVAKAALASGMEPMALSSWYTSPASARKGLLLNVAALSDEEIAASCSTINDIISRIA